MPSPMPSAHLGPTARTAADPAACLGNGRIRATFDDEGVRPILSRVARADQRMAIGMAVLQRSAHGKSGLTSRSGRVGLCDPQETSDFGACAVRLPGLANDFAALRTCSMKRSATGLKVRF